MGWVAYVVRDEKCMQHFSQKT